MTQTHLDHGANVFVIRYYRPNNNAGSDEALEED